MNQENTIRTFIGIPVHKDMNLFHEINRIRQEFEEEHFRWTNPEGYHITLKFIGNTTPAEVQAISGKLEKLTSDYSKFEIFLEGAGLFRSINNPRVLWIGAELIPELKDLQVKVSTCINLPDINPQHEIFNPHLSIAKMKRLKEKNRMQRILEKYKEFQFHHLQVKEVVFYESIQGQSGSVYKPISVHPLL